MYYTTIKNYQKEVMRICTENFKVYGNELQLKLEEYNLLENDNNCLQSSTAIGYIVEEFLVSKLEMYTNTGCKFKIQRSKGNKTNNASYDCFATIDNNILAMINIKAEKKVNNAVSAINILFDDYVNKNPNQEKCFLILKVSYSYRKSAKDNQRKIYIKGLDSFFLDEIDLGNGHNQDHRNWSENYNPNSGRLQISNSFRERHTLDASHISYQNTINMLNSIITRNKQSNN